jgi:hypothetical protein
MAAAVVVLGLCLRPDASMAACPQPPQPETMDNPAYYEYVHSYDGSCASRSNWDRSFDDVSVSASAGAVADAADRIQAITSTALGGALASLKVNGREYIASGGHGSAVQWAYHAWRDGGSASECYNPTQAGSHQDDAQGGAPWHGPSTSALYVHERGGPATIKSESRPAMYMTRSDPSPGFGGCRATDYQPARAPFSEGLSPYWLRTSVALAPDNGIAKLGNVVRMTAELASEDDVYAHFDGLLVAYLQRRFVDAFTVDPQSGAVQARQPADPGVGQPVMRCTQDRAECLGMYFRPVVMPSGYYYTLTDGPTSYNANSGEYTVQVTVPADNVGAAGLRELRYEVYIAVGTMERTVAAIRELASQPQPAPAPVAAAPVDTTPPLVSGLRVSPARFRAADRATRPASRRGRIKRGTQLRLALSESATLRIGVERLARSLPGRGRPRWRRVPGSIVRAAAASQRVRIPFAGRVGRRALRPGHYRLNTVAVDAAGNRSPAARARFRIVR